MFGEQRFLLRFVGHSAAHVANEMHNRVAMGNVDVELVERIAAEILETLLNLHGDVMPCQIAFEFDAVVAELVGNGRKKDHYRHEGLSLSERGEPAIFLWSATLPDPSVGSLSAGA